MWQENELMTSFGFGIPVDDQEWKTIRAAVDHYLEVCRQEIRAGATAPFIAHRGTLKRLFGTQKNPRKHRPMLRLDQGTYSSFKDALASYLDTCEREIANGNTVPFVTDRAIIEKIRTRLSAELERALVDLEAWLATRQRSDA
jgi:hypothetical protein